LASWQLALARRSPRVSVWLPLLALRAAGPRLRWDHRARTAVRDLLVAWAAAIVFAAAERTRRFACRCKCWRLALCAFGGLLLPNAVIAAPILCA